MTNAANTSMNNTNNYADRQKARKLQTTQSFDAPTAVLYHGFAHHADYSIFAQELPASESMLAATRTACWDMATVAVHCRRAVLARD